MCPKLDQSPFANWQTAVSKIVRVEPACFVVISDSATLSPIMTTPRPDLSGFDELDAIAKDPEKLAAFKKEIDDKARAANPNLSDEALEAQSAYAYNLFF